jgi:glycine cleavage system H lipoate-binding protein
MFRDCSVFKSQNPAATRIAQCPLLEQRLAHYCGAAPITKFIPYSDHAGRCGGEGFRFCDLYLGMARPTGPHPSASHPHVQGLAVPNDVWFAPNHMWLHIAESGVCHVGVDAFFAAVFGNVDRLSLVTSSGFRRPSAVVSIGDVDWTLVFPNPMLVTSTNVYLRHSPERIASDPFGGAWFFEGWDAPQTGTGAAPPKVCEGMASGDRAVAWMQNDVARHNHRVQQMSASSAGGHPVLNDGGTFVKGLLHELKREDILRLCSDFFSPHASWPELTR